MLIDPLRISPSVFSSFGNDSQLPETLSDQANATGTGFFYEQVDFSYHFHAPVDYDNTVDNTGPLEPRSGAGNGHEDGPDGELSGGPDFSMGADASDYQPSGYGGSAKEQPNHGFDVPMLDMPQQGDPLTM